MRARKSLLLLVTNLTRSGLGLISMLVVARLMGPVALGTITYLFGLVGLLAIVSDLGFSVAHLKRASEPGADLGTCVGTFLSVKAILSLVLLLIILLAPPISGALGHPLLSGSIQTTAYYLIALTPLLNNFSQVVLFTFEARQEAARGSVAALLGGVVTATARIIVAVFGLGVVALSLAYSLEAVAVFIAALALYRGYPVSRPRREHLTSYTQYALPVLLASVLGTATLNVNPVLIEKLWDTVEVGYYGSVLGVANLIGRLSSAAMVIFFPQASEDIALGQLDEVRRRLLVVERHLLNLTVPLAVLIACFSPEIITWLLRPDFLPAAPVLAILAIDTVVTVFFQPYSMVIYAVEKHRYLVISALIQLATLVGMGLLLIPRGLGGLGAAGAAMAMLVADLVSGLYQVHLSAKFAQIGTYPKWFAYAIAGAASYTVLWVLGSFARPLGLIKITLLVPIGVGVCLVCLALFGQFHWDDLRLYLDLVSPAKMWQYVRKELARE
ncbi:MAG: oligosaccharide flippase family protein [Chloroflexi bacterium]|nr:oligosaccharide flippase family protein [Chloroflexota bacterium]